MLPTLSSESMVGILATGGGLEVPNGFNIPPSGVIPYRYGRTETLLGVPQYSYRWQLSYYLAKPLALPLGSSIECTAHFDNSPGNPLNPDPSKAVRFGP